MLFAATLGIFSMIILMISPFFNDEKKENMKYIGITELIISVIAYKILFLVFRLA